jgi:hypothetical protein
MGAGRPHRLVTGDPYAALVGLAEREHELVTAGRYDELDALAAEREALIRTLPDTPPAWSRPALERAASLQRATTAALRAARDELRRQMIGLEERHRAVRAYART